jgi:hypothetical protein
MGMKDKLLLSFSGGETSAFMTKWCLDNWQDKYDMVVVFANTGEEREETLEFVKWCDDEYNFNTIWVESLVHHGERTGTTHRIVNYQSASRNGEPFEEVIKKYGIPNQAYPHCTRELKQAPIISYVKNELGWKDFYTAIGIRADEFDRMSDKMDEKKFIYPLCKMGITKPHINNYWSKIPNRLQLKGYEGNCKGCWKKSLRKLLTIAVENPDAFTNMIKWESEYGNYTPESRDEKNAPYTFHRNNLNSIDIIEMAKTGRFRPATDDTIETNYQQSLFGHELDVTGDCSESCEPFI